MRFVSILLIVASCLDAARPSDLCGAPPPIGGIASFTTYLPGSEEAYVCASNDADNLRAREVSLTRQWEQCMVEARDGR